MKPFDEEAIVEYTAGIFALLTERMCLSYPMNAIIRQIASTEGTEFLGSVLGSATYACGRLYRDANSVPDDEDLYVQVMFDCWEGTEEDYPDFYSQSLQFINASLNADGVAATAIWTNWLTYDTPPERDMKFLTRILCDLQHLRDHVGSAPSDHR